NQPGHVAPDGALQIRHRYPRIFAQRVRGLDERVHPAHMEEGVAQRARALVVDLHDHVARALRRRQRSVDARPQTHKPVVVRRRALQQAQVDPDRLGSKQLLDFAEEDRRIIGAPLLHRLAHVAADEQGIVPEVAFVFRKTVVGDPHGRHVQHLHILQFGAAARQHLHQFHRLRAAGVHVNPLSAAQLRQGHIRGHDPRPVVPRHGRLPRSVYTPRASSAHFPSAPSTPCLAMVNTKCSMACAMATDAERPRSAVKLGTQKWVTPLWTKVGSAMLVGRLVSMRPPWSIATSIIADPFFICSTRARVTTCGVRFPATRIAPITTSAPATASAIASSSARHVSTAGACSPMWRSLRGSRSNAITRAFERAAVRAAANPTAPAPNTTTRAGGTPGVPPSKIPRPPELDRSRCAAIGTVIWPAISLIAASTGSRPSSCWITSHPMAVRLRSASVSTRPRSATAMW